MALPKFEHSGILANKRLQNLERLLIIAKSLCHLFSRRVRTQSNKIGNSNVGAGELLSSVERVGVLFEKVLAGLQTFLQERLSLLVPAQEHESLGHVRKRDGKVSSKAVVAGVFLHQPPINGQRLPVQFNGLFSLGAAIASWGLTDTPGDIRQREQKSSLD